MTTYANPGPIGDVPPDPNIVEPTWGNAIRDRVVNNFATRADRDDFYGGLGGPWVGATCYIAESPSGLYCYTAAGVGWRPPWDTSWGLSGPRGLSDSDILMVGGMSEDDVDGDLSTTCDVIPGRTYETVAGFRLVSNLDAIRIAVYVANAANAHVYETRYNILHAEEGESFTIVLTETFDSAATVVRKIRADVIEAFPAAVQFHGADQVSSIYMKDIGPRYGAAGDPA